MDIEAEHFIFDDDSQGRLHGDVQSRQVNGRRVDRARKTLLKKKILEVFFFLKKSSTPFLY